MTRSRSNNKISELFDRIDKRIEISSIHNMSIPDYALSRNGFLNSGAFQLNSYVGRGNYAIFGFGFGLNENSVVAP